jgi:hypothetical protein
MLHICPLLSSATEYDVNCALPGSFQLSISCRWILVSVQFALGSSPKPLVPLALLFVEAVDQPTQRLGSGSCVMSSIPRGSRAIGWAGVRQSPHGPMAFAKQDYVEANRGLHRRTEVRMNRQNNRSLTHDTCPQAAYTTTRVIDGQRPNPAALAWQGQTQALRPQNAAKML